MLIKDLPYFLLSGALHIALVGSVSGSFFESARTGVVAGQHSLEVDLVSGITVDKSVGLRSAASIEVGKSLGARKSAVVGEGKTRQVDQINSDGASMAGALKAAPDFSANPPPIYPEVARRAGQEGTVVLQVRVGSDGKPKDVNIRSSSSFSALDESARLAVSRWQFRPASVSGLPSESLVVIPIHFALSDLQNEAMP